MSIRYNLPIALLFTVSVAAQQKITLEDIWQKYAYYPKSPDGFNVLKEGIETINSQRSQETSVTAVAALVSTPFLHGRRSGQQEKSLAWI